ncbi:3-keto-disaccharide hydrolase [Pedobacter hartonius]|uniref:3-keto-alpha-glucoside-1,2-lyase/3-keto-2-hydroxy-glucal hydratase domain-containing protein n=1 Tax=Pedobacter hartonius TaxID=425514 RepID=A0A1H4G7C0_9SPHI|nr:DUF1080 domain-containing protein [Pedobacter hartonius]SEB05489.1 protein of unknown function [Pedobacter hartonius]
MINKSDIRAGILIFSLSIAGLSGVSAQNSSLFDGKTLKGWKKTAGSATYQVVNGVIIGTTVEGSGNSFLVTEKEYQDFVLDIDVKLESPKGNSGVQVRSHFDPSGNQGKGKVFGRQAEIDPTDRKWSGGVYDEGRREWLYPLSLNPSAGDAYKKDDYNHLKIECIGNEMKTWINGVPASYVIDTLDKSGFIALQVHGITEAAEAGKKVYFKNIKIQTSEIVPAPFPLGIYVVNYVPNTLSSYEKKNGWELLFDGKSSKGWVGAGKNVFPARGWQIADGLISVLPAEGKESTNGGDIVTTAQFAAFDLSFEFLLTPGANSGLKYFVTLKEQTQGSAIGLEYQVLDDALHPDAKLGRDGNRTLASLYDLITADKPKRFIHPIGQWNTGRVVVYPDNRVEHYLNGIKVLDYQRASPAFRELVALSKYKDWKEFGEAKQGHILLQDHGNKVSFRSIRIRKLE